MYINENLLYYENRPLKERFLIPTFLKEDIRTVKSIVRSDWKRNPWVKDSGPHEPESGLYSCYSVGNYSPYKFW